MQKRPRALPACRVPSCASLAGAQWEIEVSTVAGTTCALPFSQVKVHDAEQGLSDGNDLVPQPLMDTHVFCKLLDDAGTVTLDE